MLRSWAPDRRRDRERSRPRWSSRRSPRYAGTPRKLVRRSSSWVKPPVAKMTALRAPIRCTAPSGVLASTPATRPLSTTTRCTRWHVRMSTPSRSAGGAQRPDGVPRRRRTWTPTRPAAPARARTAPCPPAARPVVGHRRAVPVRQRAALAQQFGRRSSRCRRWPWHIAYSQSVSPSVGLVGSYRCGPREPGDVAQEVVLGVGQPGGAHRLVVRHPVPERGLVGGAAELGCLLQQYDLVAEPAGEERGRQPAAAAADHDDIGLGVERPADGGRAASRAATSSTLSAPDVVPSRESTSESTRAGPPPGPRRDRCCATRRARPAAPARSRPRRPRAPAPSPRRGRCTRGRGRSRTRRARCPGPGPPSPPPPPRPPPRCR